jgi:hypothetical protein
LYVRREFTVTQADTVTELGLWVDYADGIIVHLNGQEVTRVNVGRSSGRNACTRIAAQSLTRTLCIARVGPAARTRATQTRARAAV